jgi:hypothetical protein
MEARAQRTPQGRWEAVIRHRVAIEGTPPFDQVLLGDYQHRTEAVEEASRFIRLVLRPERPATAPQAAHKAQPGAMGATGRSTALWGA